MQVLRTDANHPGFRELVALLDRELAIADGLDHAFFAQFNKLDMIQNVVVVEMEGKTVGCGAFKPWADDTVEIKRMYVSESHRGKGIAGEVLRALELWASELGFHTAILETGIDRASAVRLYTKSGYTRIENYGQYAGVEKSVCMRKQIG